MSSIPDYRQLKRNIPQVSGNINTAGAGANIGQGIMDVAGAVGSVRADEKQRKDASEYSKAASLMSTGLIGEKNAFNEREDYTEFDGEYQGNTANILGEHAATISDPRLRQKFIDEFKPRIAQGREQLKNVAWGKEKEYESGVLDEATRNSIDAAVESGDDEDVAAIAKSAKAYIQAQYDMGLMDETERKERTEKFNNDMAVSILKSKPPEDRVKMLEQPWAENLPASVLAELKLEAKEATIDGQVIALTDSYIEQGMTREEANKDVKKLSDTKIRKAAEARINLMYSTKARENLDLRIELKDKWFEQLALEGKTVDDIKNDGDDWDNMGADLQGQMIKTQAQRAKAAPVDPMIDSKHQYILYRLKADLDMGVDGAGLKLNQYVLDNFAEMSPAHRDAWSKISIDGLMPYETKSLFTETAMLEAKTQTLTKEQRAPMKSALVTWHYDFQKLNRRAPDAKEYKDKIDDIIMGRSRYDVSYNPFADDKRWGEMSEEEKTSILEETKNKDETLYKELSEIWKIDENITREKFIYKFNQILDARNAAK